MAATDGTPMKIKIIVDTKGRRVLFAEASKDFVDFLFTMMSLPVGTVIRLVSKRNMVGCLGNVHDSIEKLSDTYMLPRRNKDTLLGPKTPTNVPLLLPNTASSTPTELYRCGNSGRSSCAYVAGDPINAICPGCSGRMNNPVRYVDPPKTESTTSANEGEGEGGYVKGVATYIVMDNLQVMPMATISYITLLKKFDVYDLGSVEERVVYLSMAEGVELLNTSLKSETVLTDVLLNKKTVLTDVLKSETVPHSFHVASN